MTYMDLVVYTPEEFGNHPFIKHVDRTRNELADVILILREVVTDYSSILVFCLRENEVSYFPCLVIGCRRSYWSHRLFS